LTQAIQYKKQCICTVCNGTRAKPGTKAQKCSTCHGSGYLTIRQGMMIFKTNCSSCYGEGVKVTNPCTNCKATGI
jgi:molecular chaperone DnaJ